MQLRHKMKEINALKDEISNLRAHQISIGCGSESEIDSIAPNSSRLNHPLFSFILANKQFVNPSVA
jgi:hypothetical protein